MEARTLAQVVPTYLVSDIERCCSVQRRKRRGKGKEQKNKRHENNAISSFPAYANRVLADANRFFRRRPPVGPRCSWERRVQERVLPGRAMGERELFLRGVAYDTGQS